MSSKIVDRFGVTHRKPAPAPRGGWTYDYSGGTLFATDSPERNGSRCRTDIGTGTVPYYPIDGVDVYFLGWDPPLYASDLVDLAKMKLEHEAMLAGICKLQFNTHAIIDIVGCPLQGEFFEDDIVVTSSRVLNFPAVMAVADLIV